MADTLTKVAHNLERPKVTPREPLFDGYLEFDADLPDVENIPLDKMHLVDPEIWRKGAYWELFRRMRADDPLHWTEDSFAGGFWSVTRYEDIMKIDIDHKRFSSSWEHGGIVLGEPMEDFELPMFIAMDEPKHSEQRKTVQPAVAPVCSGQRLTACATGPGGAT